MKWTIIIVLISLVLSRSFAYLAEEEEGTDYPQSLAERYIAELKKDNLIHNTYTVSKQLALGQLDSADRIKVEGISLDLKIESTLGESVELRIEGDYFSEEGFELTEQLPGEWTLKFAEQPKEDSQKLFWNIGSEKREVHLKLPARIDHLDLSVVSGDVELSLAPMKRVLIKTVSGDISGSLAVKDLGLKTVSGDMELELADSLALVDLKSTSGDLKLTILSGELNGEVDFASVSGDLKVDNQSYENKLKQIFGSGSGQFKIRTISGDAEIELK